MQYLIDGNNLLHAAHSHGPGAPIGRQWLCEVTGRWAKAHAAEAIIVFDGPAPGDALVQQMRAAGIAVRFSAPQIADDVIAALIEQADRPLEIVVVSSDHALQSAARARRCACTASESFAAEIFDPPAAPNPAPPPATPPREKPAPPSRDEADHWLRRFDYDPDQPPDDTDLMNY